jgi:hypothetical protein
VTVYAPVATRRQPSSDPYAPKANDTEATAAWRARMATAEAKPVYKDRAATAETTNAGLPACRSAGLPVCRSAAASSVRLLTELVEPFDYSL